MSIKTSRESGREMNTVMLHSRLGLPEGWDETVYSREGFELVHVLISGNGPTPFNEYINRKDPVEIPFNSSANMFTRCYSRLGNVKLLGKNFGKARDSLMKKFPKFEWYIERVKILHKKTGTVLVLKNKGKDTKSGDQHRQFLVILMNGRQPEAENIPYLLNILGDLGVDLCSRQVCKHTPEVVCERMTETEYLLAHKNSK